MPGIYKDDAGTIPWIQGYLKSGHVTSIYYDIPACKAPGAELQISNNGFTTFQTVATGLSSGGGIIKYDWTVPTPPAYGTYYGLGPYSSWGASGKENPWAFRIYGIAASDNVTEVTLPNPLSANSKVGEAFALFEYGGNFTLPVDPSSPQELIPNTYNHDADIRNSYILTSEGDTPSFFNIPNRLSIIDTSITSSITHLPILNVVTYSQIVDTVNYASGIKRCFWMGASTNRAIAVIWTQFVDVGVYLYDTSNLLTSMPLIYSYTSSTDTIGNFYPDDMVVDTQYLYLGGHSGSDNFIVVIDTNSGSLGDQVNEIGRYMLPRTPLYPDTGPDNVYGMTLDSGYLYYAAQYTASLFKLDITNKTSPTSVDNMSFSDGEGGVFVSSDNGNSWTQKNGNLTNTDIRGIAKLGSNIFASLGYANFGGPPPAYKSQDVVRSTDGGTTWSTALVNTNNNFPFNFSISSSTIFATGEYLFKSDDNGITWDSIRIGISAGAYIYAIGYTGSQLIAVTSYDEPAYHVYMPGVYTSSDGGTTWGISAPPINTFSGTSIIVSGSYIFAGSHGNGVYKSNDGAITWTACGALPTNVINSLAYNSTAIFASTTKGIYYSINAGTTWNPTTSSLPVASGDCRARTIISHGNDIYASMLDSVVASNPVYPHGYGIYSSSNGTSNWSPANTGLYNFAITSMFSDGTNIYAGAYGDGFRPQARGVKTHVVVNNKSYFWQDIPWGRVVMWDWNTKTRVASTAPYASGHYSMFSNCNYMTFSGSKLIVFAEGYGTNANIEPNGSWPDGDMSFPTIITILDPNTLQVLEVTSSNYTSSGAQTYCDGAVIIQNKIIMNENYRLAQGYGGGS